MSFPKSHSRRASQLSAKLRSKPSAAKLTSALHAGTGPLQIERLRSFLWIALLAIPASMLADLGLDPLSRAILTGAKLGALGLAVTGLLLLRRMLAAPWRRVAVTSVVVVCAIAAIPASTIC